MIAKIENIKNIGNYEDYQASGDVSLKKMNMVYAENGAGKTTLSRILYSLSNNDSNIINNHVRIGATDDPSVSIKDSLNCQHTYNGVRWNNIIPEIAVFDAHFVAENIYTGFQISPDHRKHLYQFVLGSTGVKIAAKIERVKGLIDKTNNDYSALLAQIRAESKIADADYVLAISKDSDIDNKIAAKSQELQIAQDNSIITNHPSLSVINNQFTIIDFDNLIILFNLTIEGIGNEYLNLVHQHINELNECSINNASYWLHTGLNYINNKKRCPYCGSDVTEIDLVKGYNQFFNEQYKAALTAVEEQKRKLSQVNIDNILTQIHSSYEKISESLLFWKRYIMIEEQLPVLAVDDSNIKSLFAQIDSSLDAKKANPMSALPIEMINNLRSKLGECFNSIQKINQYVELFNTKIAEIKTNIRKVEDVRRELSTLQLVKSRYESPLRDLCLKASITKRHVEIWNKINRQLQQDQKSQSNVMFSQYGNKINYYLSTVFGTKFHISEIKDGGFKGRAKEADLSYILTFNGTPIEQNGTGNTSFKNVLSEGDKNTIAFSFFLAKLQLDSDFAQKIIIFDDPLTSLDLNRRNATIHQLCLLYKQCQQLIVLSHNLHFLVELNSQNEIKAQDKKILQIVYNGNQSNILEYEIKKEWLMHYQKALLSMKEFLDNPTSEQQEIAVNAIRISLETFLKLKFCLSIPNPDGTFGQIVNSLENSTCVFVNSDKTQVIDELKQLVRISWRGHHGSIEERDQYTEENLSMAEAIRYVQMANRLLYSEL